jgi:hypothetical protein
MLFPNEYLSGYISSKQYNLMLNAGIAGLVQ